MVKNWQGNIREKHHCLTLNKWCSNNDKIVFERIIIVQHQINGFSIDDKMKFGRIIIIKHQIIDGQTMIKLC